MEYWPAGSAAKSRSEVLSIILVALVLPSEAQKFVILVVQIGLALSLIVILSTETHVLAGKKRVQSISDSKSIALPL